MYIYTHENWQFPLYPVLQVFNKGAWSGAQMEGAVKFSDKNEKEWTEEQMREGRQGHLSLLTSGSNQGASQAGLNMGKQRMVMD